MKQTIASIISNNEIMPRTHLVWLECPQIPADAKPGQFVMVNCGEDCYLPRPFSVHQVDGSKLALLFEVTGKGTSWLSEHHKGDKLQMFGPLGNGFTIYPDSKNLLLVAGGMGVAPMCFLVQEASKRNCSTKLLIGGKTAAQCYPENLLPDGLDPVYASEDATLGKPGRITAFVPDYFDWADQIFACGPLGMYRAMAQIPDLKNKPVQVSLEIVMGCGVGVCYGCTIRTKSGLKQVCRDGPVFELSDLDNATWDGLVL